jgi:hypothetical protein
MRSVFVTDPDRDWVASERMRWTMSEMLDMPPSAVCRIDDPWEALVADWVSTVTSDSREVPTASPAASSDALVMREPLAIFDTEDD